MISPWWSFLVLQKMHFFDCFELCNIVSYQCHLKVDLRWSVFSWLSSYTQCSLRTKKDMAESYTKSGISSISLLACQWAHKDRHTKSIINLLKGQTRYSCSCWTLADKEINIGRKGTEECPIIQDILTQAFLPDPVQLKWQGHRTNSSERHKLSQATVYSIWC